MSVYNWNMNHASVRIHNAVSEQSYIPDHPTPLILGELGAASRDDATFSSESFHKEPALATLRLRHGVEGNPHPSPVE